MVDGVSSLLRRVRAMTPTVGEAPEASPGARLVDKVGAVARRLVIFDCDGVLVDSERLAVDIDVRLLTELGWPITRDEVIHRFLGKSEADVLLEVEQHLGHPMPPGWDAGWATEYRRVFAAELEPVPGVAAAVESLRTAGYAVCVGSSGGHAKIRRSLDQTGLRAFFGEQIFSAEDVARGKPAPDLFLHAARSLGARPEETVVVEDSQYGVEAAHAAGMAVIGYAGGITPRQQLAAADRVVDDMAALPDAVAGLPRTHV